MNINNKSVGELSVLVESFGQYFSYINSNSNYTEEFILLGVIAVSASFEALLMNLKRGHAGIDGRELCVCLCVLHVCVCVCVSVLYERDVRWGTIMRSS